VAEALITTVAGLVVAIPSVIAYNIFTARQNFVAAELEGFARELIVTLAREGRLWPAVEQIEPPTRRRALHRAAVTGNTR